MSFNEIFDKIIRRKVSESESEFPFDENNWLKASRMIDAERGASGLSKSSKLFLLFGSLFLVTATVVLFSLSNGDDAKGKTDLSENKTIINGDTKNQNTNNDQKAADLLADKPAANNTTDVGTGITDNEVNTTNISKTNTEEKTIAETNNNSDVKNPKDENVTADSKTEVAVKPAETNSGSDPAAKESNPSSNVSASNSGSGEYSMRKEGDKSGANKNGKERKKIGSVTNTNRQPLGAKKADPSQTKTTRQNKSVIQPDPQILNSAPEVKETEKSEMIEARPSVLQIWNKEEVLRNTPYDFIRIYDEDYFKKSRRNIHFLNVEVGGTYLFGWETSAGKDGKGFNAFGGLNYGLHLSKKISFSVGAQVYNVGNIKQAFYSRANLNYDFGSTGNYTQITTNSLYYFSIPARAFYNVSGRGQVGLGLNAGFLFNGKSTVENYSLADNVKNNDVITKTKGYYDGLSKTNLLLSAFYNYSISRRVKLNAEVIYGLSDTYNNSISKSATKEQNKGLRLSLQYIIGK